MPIRSNTSQTPSHSNALENRITRVEIQGETHAGKLSYLERAVHGIIYAIAVLATSKSSDIVDLMLQLLRAKL